MRDSPAECGTVGKYEQHVHILGLVFGVIGGFITGADPGFSAGQLTAIAEVVQRAVDKAIADRSRREGDGSVPRSSEGASGATPGELGWVMDPGRGRACRDLKGASGKQERAGYPGLAPRGFKGQGKWDC